MIPARGLARSAALAAVLLTAGCEPAPPPHPDFSAERAWAHVETQVAFGPRYAGHRAHERQLRWLRQQLAFRADTVVEQEFRHQPVGADTALRFVNLLARFNPGAEERILVTAHWDAARRATRSFDAYDQVRPPPGANVNASAVAVMVELAELFRQQRPAAGVDLLFTDGDGWEAEGESPGTRHYLETLAGGAGPRYAVLLQGVAGRGDRIPMDETSLATAEAPLRRMWEIAARRGQDTVFVDTPASSGRTAAPVLAEAGVPVVVVMARDTTGTPTYAQTVHDLPSAVSRNRLAAVGRVLAELLYREE